tara:strand:+ start:1036 stop:1287 length:252 start_codon:yes stop_codon:yes gene_type:complete
MCICVNCAWVDRCKTYHKVEENHGAKHISQSPDFQGVNPKIHINISNIQNNGIGIEWDVRACDSFEQDQGKWSRLRPGEEIPK